MSIATFGLNQGSFHHEAVEILTSPAPAELEYRKTFPEVFNAVRDGEAHFGVVASENTLDGFIPAVYKQLNNHDVSIVKDLRMHIVQNLIGAAAVDLSDLGTGKGVKVLSYRVALGQVETWLDEHLPDAERVEKDDTATSVKEVVESQDPKMFAIAGIRAATEHGGRIIVPNIQDDPNNRTRFIMFQKDEARIPDATHGSLIIDTNEDKEGIIYNIAGVFHRYKSSMTKLTSQPRNTQKRTYRFFIDYVLNSSNGDLIDEIRGEGHQVRVLGFYTSYEYEDGRLRQVTG